jgi:hypothetical protein
VQPEPVLSEAVCELAERDADSVVSQQVGCEFVVSATQVLDERVPRRDGSSRAQSFQSSHRAQSGFEPTVVRFDDICSRPSPARAARPAPARRSRTDTPVPGSDLNRSGTEVFAINPMSVARYLAQRGNIPAARRVAAARDGSGPDHALVGNESPA